MLLWNSPKLPDTIFGPRQTETFEELFDNAFGTKRRPHGIKEVEDGFVYEFDVPGLDKSEIEIEVTKGYLSVKGKSASRQYNYLVGMPIEVDEDKTEAALINGVLSVTIKKMVKKEKKSKIEIK